MNTELLERLGSNFAPRAVPASSKGPFGGSSKRATEALESRATSELDNRGFGMGLLVGYLGTQYLMNHNAQQPAQAAPPPPTAPAPSPSSTPTPSSPPPPVSTPAQRDVS